MGEGKFHTWNPDSERDSENYLLCDPETMTCVPCDALAAHSYPYRSPIGFYEAVMDLFGRRPPFVWGYKLAEPNRYILANKPIGYISRNAARRFKEGDTELMFATPQGESDIPVYIDREAIK